MGSDVTVTVGDSFFEAGNGIFSMIEVLELFEAIYIVGVMSEMEGLFLFAGFANNSILDARINRTYKQSLKSVLRAN